MDRRQRVLIVLQDRLLLLVWCFGVVRLAGGQDVTFSFSNDTQTMKCENSLLHCEGDAFTFDRSFIRLTADEALGVSSPMNSIGWVFYNEGIRMMDPSTGEAASFSTVFTFKLTPSLSWGADGLAFVMFANQYFKGGAGGALGAYNSNLTEGTKTFCVEYDTFKNYFDPSNNHVGLDLQNVSSVTYANASDVGILLSSGTNITSWIDYNHSKTTVEVRISDVFVKPIDPLFNYPLNLSTVVDELMYVGFSASTGSGYQTEDLLRWDMSVFGLSSAPSPESPTASPQFSPPSSPKLSSPPSPEFLAPSSPKLTRSLNHTSNQHGALIGGVSGVVVLLVVCCGGIGLWLCLKRRGEYLGSGRIELGGIPVDMPYRFTYKQLSVATNGFSEESKLGQGGSSGVYRGAIASMGESVAVKRLAETYRDGEKDFLAEISVVSRLRHRHLVKLLGWCADRGFYLLVYELMPNGSLDKLLFRPEEHEVLSWDQRVAIVKGVAAGLAYLHEGFSQQVIHRDIKSSNVMLDKDFKALVGDFGLARVMEHSSKMQKTQLAGTFGYIAPEAAVSGEFSAKTDVYAFGAVVLEVACGQPARGMANDGKTLLDLVWDLRSENRILKAADERLEGNFPIEEMEHILLLGLLCSHPDPDARPSMQEVELILAKRVPLPPVPLGKPILHYSSNDYSKWMSMMNSNQTSSSSSFSSKPKLNFSSTDSSISIDN